MFNLIITIISIALVAVLAIATIYYGGSAFNQGSAKASASTLVAHGQQIAAANTLHANDHGGAMVTLTADADSDGTVDLIEGGYLTSVPKSPNAGDYSVNATTGLITATMAANTDPVCVEVNKSLGSTATAVPLAQPNTQYGCYDLDGDILTTADHTFFFKG